MEITSNPSASRYNAPEQHLCDFALAGAGQMPI
jgi:hypothetical protein